ncbi:MAG: metallophosphoesterase, partial [Oscillospiraceae bacterium]|nr:metallophosphoesterase [Oscillospiraceae bacterium]
MKKLRAFVLCLLVLALLAGGLWFGNNVLQTEEFTFRSSDLPAGFDGWRVMVLADLHGKSFGSQQEKLLAAVKNEAPEAIFLIGDLVDERTEDAEGYCTQLGAALSALAPTYYVTGNHEWARHDAPAIKKTLQEAGVTVLSNEFLPIGRGDDTVILAGIDDPNGYADQKTPEQLASELYAACGDPFWLLLAHRNDHFAAQYSLLGADLTIS